MINIINAAIFGIVQGITEFLPISSSGHLLLLHEFIDLPIPGELAFDVTLHLATAMAVIVFFRRDLLKLFSAWASSLTGEKNRDARLAWLIIIATVPAALAGWFFEDIIDSALRSVFVVAFMLALVGVFFIIFEKYFHPRQSWQELNIKKALIIGCAQALALIPGTSRSGATILAGIGAGLKREDAVKFSFLLSVPIILGASAKEVPSAFGYFMASPADIGVTLAAFTAAFLTGILTIKYFLRFSRKYSLNVFALYRFILAAAVIAYFAF